MLAAFIAAIARVLREGRTPDCHCFGQIHSAPATNSTLIRNAGLLAVAVFVALAGPGKAIDGQLATLDATQAPLLATSRSASRSPRPPCGSGAKTAPKGSGTPRRRQPPDRRRPLPVGSPAPDFTLLDEHDQPATLQALLAAGRR